MKGINQKFSFLKRKFNTNNKILNCCEKTQVFHLENKQMKNANKKKCMCLFLYWAGNKIE